MKTLDLIKIFKLFQDENLKIYQKLPKPVEKKFISWKKLVWREK